MKKLLNKWVFWVVIIAIIAVTGVVLYLVFKSDGPSKNDAQAQVKPSIDGSSVPARENDIIADGIDVLKQKYPDKDQLFEQLTLIAYQKELFVKYVEAQQYYESAIENAPNDQKQKDAQYLTYLFAERTQNQALMTKYENILSKQYIDTKKKEASDAANSR